MSEVIRTAAAINHPLQDLADQLAMAQVALRAAAALCPGNEAMQAGLLERAAWCRDQFWTTRHRLANGLMRRAHDR
jgi:hypothetical protein